MKEKGDNLTSEKLARLSIEDMVKAILAKSGVVSFSRTLRVIKDALIVQGNCHLLDKEEIFAYLCENSRMVLPKVQCFIANS